MDDIVFKGLVSFVKENSSASVVLQGLQNRSRIVKDCAIITFIEKTVRGTSKSVIELDFSVDMVGSQVLSVYQLDMYGDNAYNQISRLRTLYTNEIGIKHFHKYGFAPIMTTKIKNLTASTLINDEYIKRYSIDLVVSYRDNTAIEAEFIDEINVKTQEVKYGIVNI